MRVGDKIEAYGFLGRIEKISVFDPEKYQTSTGKVVYGLYVSYIDELCDNGKDHFRFLRSREDKNLAYLQGNDGVSYRVVSK